MSGLFSAERQGTDVTTKFLEVYDIQNVRNLGCLGNLSTVVA